VAAHRRAAEYLAVLSDGGGGSGGSPARPDRAIRSTGPVVDFDDHRIVLIDPDGGVAAHRREAEYLAALSDGGGGSGGSPARPDRPLRSTSPVVDFDDHSIVLPGSSTLTRRADRISIHLETSGLTPGHAYTFWWGIVSSPGADFIGGRITGFVVGRHGRAEVSGHQNVGRIVGNPPIPGHEGTLTSQDALHAQIMVVVRDHGPADPARLFEQTHTYEPDVAVNVRVSIHDFR
jgi:hypothetical protein